MARMRRTEWGRDSWSDDRTDWGAAVGAGVIAGIAFMILEMLMVWAFLGQSPWAPPRMIAAMALGREVLPPPASFDWGVFTAAMLIHFALSIIYGLISGWIVHRAGNGNAILICGFLGLAIYFINFFLIAPAAFPWFVEAQSWVSFVAHLVFGLVLGASYAGLRKHKPNRQAA